MAALIAAPLVGLGLSAPMATTIATLGLYAATTAASIFLQMAMAEEPQQETGTKLQAVLGGAVNQAIHMGRKETAGSFIYKGTWGSAGKIPNAFLTRVYCLSDRPVDGFDDYVWVDGVKCHYDPDETHSVEGVNVGHPIHKYDANGGQRMWVKFHDGTQTTADAYLTAKFDSGPRKWTSDMVGRGRAYMIVTQKWDKKEPTGEMEVLAVVKNSRLYDFRLDSTNGGSGTQRYSDYSTWAVNPGNPIICAYDTMRGIYRSDEWLYGGKKWPATRFDISTWTAAANQCDTDVPTKDGGSIKWSRMGAEIDVSEEPWTVIERMLKACDGRIVESGGKFKVYVGGIGASVYSFTDDDVILSEDLSGRTFPTRDQIANTVNGTYIEPDNAGEAKAYKPRTKAEYVAEDGDVRKTTLDFDYVRDNRQAQRLAELALNDNRRFRTFSVAFWTQARKLEPCDVVSWTSERFQFTNKKFILGDVVLREDGIVVANLREADANDANWNALTDENPFDTGVFEDLDEPTQTLVATVTAVPFTDDTGKARRPAIRIQAAIDDDFVDCQALLYQVRKQFGDQKIIHRGRSETFFDPDNADYGDITFTSQSIATLKAKWVQVRYKIEPESDRPTEWSDWADHAVNLDDLGIDDDDTTDGALAAPSNLTLAKVQDEDEDGKIQTYILMDCTPPAGATSKTTYTYEVTVDGVTPPFTVKSKDPRRKFLVQKTGVLHSVRVQAVQGVGSVGAWSSAATITPTKKANSVPTPSGMSARALANGNRVKCDDPTFKHLDWVLTYANNTNNFGTATLVDKRRGFKFRDDDPPGSRGDTTYYWKRFIDKSDNIGSASASVSVTNRGVDDEDTDDALLPAPTGLSVTKVQEKDEDGTIRTYLRMDCTYPGWASDKADAIYEITVTGAAKPFREVGDNGKAARFRVNKTGVLHSVRARIKGGVGRLSNWTSAVTITPSKKAADASAVTGVSISRKNGAIVVRWDRISDPDNREVAIYRGTTNVFASMTEIGRTKANKWRDDDNIVKGTRYYYRIIPVDTSDNLGASASLPVDDVETGIGDDDTNDGVFSAPSGLSLTKVQDVDEDGKVQTYIQMACTAPAGATSKTTYEFEVTVGGVPDIVKSGGVNKRFRVHKTSVLHSVRVRAIMGVGSQGAWSGSSSITPSKKTGSVPAVGSVTRTNKVSKIVLKWADVDDDTYPDYKRTFIWRNTTGVTPTPGSTAPYEKTSVGKFVDENVTTGVTYSYWVAHMDQSRNFSGLAGPITGASGGDEVQTFADLSGTITTPQVGTSVITTPKISANAASSSAYIHNTGAISVSGAGGESTLASLAIDLTDNQDIAVGIQHINIDTVDRDYTIRIYKDGGLVFEIGATVPAGALFFTETIFSGHSGSSAVYQYRVLAGVSHFVANRAIFVRPRKR